MVAVNINKELRLKVDAVDFSEKQAEKADVRVFHEDIMSPSPESGLHYGNYDIVLCKDVIALYVREDKKAFIAELLRYVKSGGHLVMSVLSDESNEYLVVAKLK